MNIHEIRILQRNIENDKRLGSVSENFHVCPLSLIAGTKFNPTAQYVHEKTGIDTWYLHGLEDGWYASSWKDFLNNNLTNRSQRISYLRGYAFGKKMMGYA